ncbi:hypothetical protein FKW77_003720 [Venturia effusa]|uniref:Uncharacterized protein n=1 Tax=Venturia effusa TaxID=50376 RepID=A0A517LGX2_9PEZI|nr:hypothetical protein FKW77_003720 [Venturia effusa]
MKILPLFFLMPALAIAREPTFMISGGVKSGGDFGVVMVSAGPSVAMTRGGVDGGGSSVMSSVFGPPMVRRLIRKAKMQGDKPRIVAGIQRPRTLREKE